MRSRSVGLGADPARMPDRKSPRPTRPPHHRQETPVLPGASQDQVAVRVFSRCFTGDRFEDHGSFRNIASMPDTYLAGIFQKLLDLIFRGLNRAADREDR